MLTATMRLLLILACCAASLAGLDLRPYAGPDASLASARSDRALPVWRALTVESYAQNGVHGVWDQDMQRLLEQLALSLASKQTTMPMDELRALAKRMTDLPDPLGAFAAFVFTEGRDERWRAGWKALRTMDDDRMAHRGAYRHPRLLEAIVAGELLDGYRGDTTDDRRAKAVKLAQRLGEALAAAITAAEYGAWPATIIHRVHAMKFNHQDYGEPVRQAIDAAVDSAKPEAWVGLALKGTVRINNAWGWRGTGWASTVTAEGWKGFERNLSEADAMLSAAWLANPQDPLVPAYACTLAGAGYSATPLQTWMERSAKACFDHPVAFQAAMSFLQPRWGGSYEQMLDIGCDGVDTGRFDTSVPWWIIKAVRATVLDARSMQKEEDMRQALSRPRVLAAVDRCLAGYQEVHPDEAKRYATTRAIVHLVAGREQQARAAIAHLHAEDIDVALCTDFAVDLKPLLRPTAGTSAF